MKILNNDMYLLLIDEEAETKPNKYALNIASKEVYKTSYSYRNLDKITGARSIIAYRKLNEEAKELDLPELPPFELDVEKLAEDKYGKYEPSIDFPNKYLRVGFIEGYKAAQSKRFTLDDVKKAFHTGRLYQGREGDTSLEEIIQSLSTQQLPKEFIPDYQQVRDLDNRDINGDYNSKLVLKTITNSEGKEVLVGTYKY